MVYFTLLLAGSVLFIIILDVKKTIRNNTTHIDRTDLAEWLRVRFNGIRSVLGP